MRELTTGERVRELEQLLWRVRAVNRRQALRFDDIPHPSLVRGAQPSSGAVVLPFRRRIEEA